MRKIGVEGITSQIRPCSGLSSLRALSDQVENALLLLRLGVPFWAIAYVCGRNPMYWYRLFLRRGASSLVGTTVHTASKLPWHGVADDYHVPIKGMVRSIATTCANGCLVGVEAVNSVCAEALQHGSGVFTEDAQRLLAPDKPHTVNTDGWQATHTAWRALFAPMFVIECFLHAYLTGRDRATTALRRLFATAADTIWHISSATTKRQMGQRIRRLSEWSGDQLPDSPMKDTIIPLCHKRKRW